MRRGKEKREGEGREMGREEESSPCFPAFKMAWKHEEKRSGLEFSKDHSLHALVTDLGELEVSSVDGSNEDGVDLLV